MNALSMTESYTKQAGQNHSPCGTSNNAGRKQ